MEHFSVTVDEEQEGERIDILLVHSLGETSRSQIQKEIRSGQITADGRAVRPSFRCGTGCRIEGCIPEPEPLSAVPEPIPLDILYEDDDLIFVNKPKGMVVHPGPGHETGTLVNGLMAHCGEELSTLGGPLRRGIVHRIDRDTTGVLVACKNNSAHERTAAQLAAHSVTRRYYAIVHGELKEEEGTIDLPIGRDPGNRLKRAVDPEHGKRAVTHYRVLEHFSGFTLVECRLETGRTHQIRVHMTAIHHPLLGDTVYGSRPSPFRLEGQTLHAGVLGLIHPRTGEYLEVTAPLPEYFSHLLHIL